jgi:hypothetical protein
VTDTYEVRMSLRVSGGPDRAAHFETVVDAFAALEVVHAELLDSSFGFTDGGAHADLDAELTVRAVGEREAYRLASSCVRSAIQAAGGATPEWDELAPHDLATAVYRVTDESVGLVSA